MDLNLKGKVAMVTGTGSQIGFGKSIALTLAKEGCNVVSADINFEGAKTTAAEIQTLGCEAIAFKIDVTSSSEVNDTVQAALKEFGKIDILVNNAGTSSPPKPFIEMTETECDFDINVNLRGVMNCTRAVLSHMISQKYGKIINISSGAGLIGCKDVAAYSAAKAGIIAFSQALAAEVGPLGINVNNIAPGFAATGLVGNAKDNPEFLQRFADQSLIGRLTVPQDIATVVAFLASDVSMDIIGQTIRVAGKVLV